MQQATKTPIHLWIIAIVSLLWNSMGAVDYSASQLKIEAYMSQFTQEQLDYFYGFPAWAIAAWAVGVWGAFLGSIALLLRKSWAVWLFGASILGLAVNSIYTYGISNGTEIMGEGAIMFTGVIAIVALFLFFYAQAMAKRGVLR